MSEISFNCLAYSKLMLHAAKYPHCSVNGLLLAKANTGKGKDIEFVDAVPLFHISINLTPMAEIALTQIEHKISKSGLVIAGYYVAHENFKETSMDKSNHRISDKIAEYFPNACLVIVDNINLNFSHMDNLAIKVAQFNDGKYKPVDIQRVSLSQDQTLEGCSSMIMSRMFEQLYDFDNHLDDVSIDFMNNSLNKEIELYTT